MLTVLFSLVIACGAVLLFSGYRRRARQQHDLQIFRNRIMFGTSEGSSDERIQERVPRIVNGQP